MSAWEAADGTDLRPWVENWWNTTGNPLYAWEAIARSLDSREPIPEWALGYLKDAANNMLALAHGRDFRKEDASKIGPKEAFNLVRAALGLGREATKNAFIRRADDANASYAALDDEFYGRARARQEAKTRKNLVEEDRAADRMIKAGYKLNRTAGAKNS